MNYWSREHEALLAALRAGTIVPGLVRRLSLERASPGDAEVRRLRDWASAIRDDPGWAAISRALDNPAAWPGAWEEAVALGFSPRSDHHHALLFASFAEQALADQDWEGASWAWRECVAAWSRVFASAYPAELYEDLAPNLTPDGPDRAELLRTMLDRLVDGRLNDLREASGVARPGFAPDLNASRLRFAWRALDQLRSAKEGPDPHGTLARLFEQASEAMATASGEVLARFEKAVTEIDLSAASGSTLTGPFEWVAAYFDAVGLTEAAVTTVVSAIVDTCWGLRRVDRDEIPEFGELLELGKPFNSDLFRRLRAFDSAFGHNSRCADFLVFVGEKQTGDARKVTFQAGLDVCPGHRNSAMLLSWEHIRAARKNLVETATTLAIAARVPGASGRIEQLLRETRDHLDEAERIYPYNEALPDVRANLEKELSRFNVTLE